MEKNHPLIESVRLRKIAKITKADPEIIKKLEEIIKLRTSELLDECSSSLERPDSKHYERKNHLALVAPLQD